ncbi:MAG: helicase-related protein [bacterium]|nr:helicase-related protein [bacterium]
MSELLPGTQVRVRGLLWEVISFEPSLPHSILSLRGLEGGVKGQTTEYLLPFESVARIQIEITPDKPSPVNNWNIYHKTFLLEQSFGNDALLAGTPGRLQIEPYQLVPVIRALRSSRVRLLLADSVGLGKTIQAGLVLTGLIARRIAHRILIVSPAGPLLEQWNMEMRERFGLRFEKIDRFYIDSLKRKIELGANPFDQIQFGLASLDFLKQERMLEYLERSNYDIIVIDEVHHCTDNGDLNDREGSQRRRLAEILSRRSDALLLLTATPHDGNDRSFASICELLDSSLVDGRGDLRGNNYMKHVIRRLKKHIVDPVTKEQKFQERKVKPVPVSASNRVAPHFVELHKSILELIVPMLTEAFKKKQYSDVLAFFTLLKRSVSTVEACRSTLNTILERLQTGVSESSLSLDEKRQRQKTLRDFQKRMERYGSLSAEEEIEQERIAIDDLTAQLAQLQKDIRSGSRFLSKRTSVVEALQELASLADNAVNEDIKIMSLIDEIRQVRTEEPDSNIIIYTEFTDSQAAVVRALNKASVGTIIQMSGEDSDKDRSKITERFRTESPLILVSTDAAAEGLNLHQKCHHLIHLELPFNPNRLEQRNGRIDRYGQKYEPIVRYLFLKRSFEERILWRLIQKYERQRAKLTFVPNTLGNVNMSDNFPERLLSGLVDSETQLFDVEAEPNEYVSGNENDGADVATKELLEEIDRSFNDYLSKAKNNSWLGDVGANADEGSLLDAETARRKGRNLSDVNLLSFLSDAVRLEGGRIKQSPSHPAVIELELPHEWRNIPEDTVGYEASTRTIRLTSNVDVMNDDNNHAVGFLGRAHPLVRIALDKMRRLSYGSDSNLQDVRASAVEGDVTEPTLLFTFLGRVNSQARRELEQVVAVRINATGQSEYFSTPDQWMKFADVERGIRLTDVYSNHFSSWYNSALDSAKAQAKLNLQPVVEKFSKDWLSELEVEKQEQERWLRLRTNEITGTVIEAATQTGLFDSSTSQTSIGNDPSWQSLTDPLERLARFATDKSNHLRSRSEADGVLRIYRKRMEDLTARMALQPSEVFHLGVLMILPKGVQS